MDGFLSTTNLYRYRNLQISSLQIDYQQIADLANFRQIDNEPIANLKIVIYLKTTKNITIMYLCTTCIFAIWRLGIFMLSIFRLSFNPSTYPT